MSVFNKFIVPIYVRRVVVYRSYKLIIGVFCYYSKIVYNLMVITYYLKLIYSYIMCSVQT